MAEFRLTAGRSRLARLHQAGCLKLRFPRTQGASAEAVLINSSGGLTGGDRLEVEMSVGAGASLSLTTQACERVYRAASGEARIATSVSVAPDAGFAYLPQETILFDGGALARRLDVDCAASSRVLLVESVVLGRTLMGETVVEGKLTDRWRVRRDGRLVFAEELRLEGPIDALAAEAAGLGGAKAFATVMAQLPEGESLLDTLRDLIGPDGGASAFDGLVVARIVAGSGFLLRKRLIPVLAALSKAPLPLVWSL
ncbi:urease accessory protein UreD [Aureimonas glaciei]|jgi:urease accessory protein|uniref:Urease accessory protein UreD n=1 Tax=Aureimonas glaciei TaxID=1776957 RepID=A0A917DGK3_9HYPH|nr:urease accessory protein UreD [Aureimonas glaciei]GGD36522.1 urease accessory protein UreD [Aureimonas glaciei]